MLKPNYEINFKYNGDNYTKEAIAFDIGITHPGCMTIIFPSNGRLIIDMTGVESYRIESLVEKW